MFFRIIGWAVLLSLAFADPLLEAQDVSVQGRVIVKHAGKPRADENENVVLWLNPLDRPAPQPVSSRQYRLLQKGKQFSPHVLAVPVGAEVDFPNHDILFHNVFSLYKGKRFDLGLYEAGSSRRVRFDKPGVSFLFCNIHPDMIAYILALETPYFAISDRRGTVSIPGVPPGRYRLEVWYENAESNDLAALSREVTVAPPQSSLGTIEVQESMQHQPQHPDKHGRAYDAERPKPY